MHMLHVNACLRGNNLTGHGVLRGAVTSRQRIIKQVYATHLALKRLHRHVQPAVLSRHAGSNAACIQRLLYLPHAADTHVAHVERQGEIQKKEAKLDVSIMLQICSCEQVQHPCKLLTSRAKLELALSGER